MRRVDSRTVPTGHVPLQTFVEHSMHFLESLYKYATLFEKCRYIPLSQWPDEWRRCFNVVDVDTLLTLDTTAQEVTVKKSTILHPDSGLGSFSAHKKGEEKVV